MPGFRQVPLNDFLYGQQSTLTPFSSTPQSGPGWTAVEGGWQRNLNRPYDVTVAGAGSQQDRDWTAQQVLGGQNPTEWFRNWNAQRGIDQDTFQGWDQGGARYDPTTGMVTVPNELGGDALGGLLLGGLAAGVGGLSGGFGLGELFGGAGGAGGLEELASLTGSGGSGGAGVGGFGGFGGVEPSWGVNPQGGNMFEFGNYNPSDPFNFAGDTATNLTNYGTGGGVENFLPGGQFSQYGGLGGMVDLGGAGALAGVNLGGSASLLEVLRQATGLSNRDLLNLGGRGLAALLQAYSSNQQSNALTGLADRYSAQGAPSRARFEASMQPGFDPRSIPGYQGALDTASESLLARLSAQGGNPFGNPQGLIQANRQIVNGTALPAINEYQRLNLGAGGLANLNAAIPSLQTGAIQNDAGGLAALGSFLGSATAPDNSLAGILKQLQGYGLKFTDGTGLS